MLSPEVSKGEDSGRQFGVSSIFQGIKGTVRTAIGAARELGDLFSSKSSSWDNYGTPESGADSAQVGRVEEPGFFNRLFGGMGLDIDPPGGVYDNSMHDNHTYVPVVGDCAGMVIPSENTQNEQ